MDRRSEKISTMGPQKNKIKSATYPPRGLENIPSFFPSEPLAESSLLHGLRSEQSTLPVQMFSKVFGAAPTILYGDVRRFTKFTMMPV